MDALQEYGGLVTKDVWRYCRLASLKCGDVYEILDRMMLEGHITKTEEGEESFWRPVGMPLDTPRTPPFSVSLTRVTPCFLNEHEVTITSGGLFTQTIKVTPEEAQILIRALEPLAYPKEVRLWPKVSIVPKEIENDSNWL